MNSPKNYTFVSGVLPCRKCGKGISRKRGNLRTRASLFRAIEALRLKHELKCTGAKTHWISSQDAWHVDPKNKTEI